MRHSETKSPLKQSTMLRDIGIVLLGLPIGLGLVWAGNNSNAIDFIITISILLVPMASLFFLASNWPKPDLD